MPKFRLLAGSHVGPDMTGAEKYWSQGEVIETLQDLTLLNGRGVGPKFARLQDEGPVTEEGLIAERDRINQQLADLAKARTVPTAPKTPVQLAAEQGFKSDPPSKAPTSKAEMMAHFSKMSQAELKEHCENEEIPMGNATTKEQILAVLKKFHGA